MPAHAARAPHCGRGGAGFGSILHVEVIRYTKVQFALSKGVGKPTSFVVANLPRAQLRRLPTDCRHRGHGKSVIWLKHVLHGSS